MADDEGSEGCGEERVLEWLDLRAIYEAPDEPTAIHIQAFLCGAGIDARIRSAQIAGFDGAYAAAIGYWGHVLVPLREVVRAKALLESFLAETERGAADGGADQPGNQEQPGNQDGQRSQDRRGNQDQPGSPEGPE